MEIPQPVYESAVSFYLYDISVSSVFNGKQMVAVLNELDVDLAVYGNHDFGMPCFLLIKIYNCKQ